MARIVLPTVSVVASLIIAVYAFWHNRTGIGIVFIVVAVALFVITLIFDAVRGPQVSRKKPQSADERAPR